MKLQKRSEWRTYHEDKKTGEKCEFLLKQVPPIVAERIFKESFGDSIEVRRKKGEEIQRWDVDDQKNARIKTALVALDDSRGYEHLVADETQAKALASALSAELAAGDYVLLDGKWSDAVKPAVLPATF